MTVWIQNPFDSLPLEGFRKQRYWLMAEAFVAAGHDVTYFTSDFSHVTKRPRKLAEGATGGIRLVLLRTRPYRKNVSLARVLSHRAYAREWERVAVGRPDVIISSMPTLSAAEVAVRLGRRLGARVVLDVQDAWPETFERLAPRGLRLLARLLLWPLRCKARRLYRTADRVTGVCDAYRHLTGRDDYYRAYLGVEI